MNSLVDEDIIRALYDAAKAGVEIRLNVRGICCLRPGLKGTSDDIEVVSIVDRFLEHSRIFHFRNGGDEEVYLASADWMPRNLDRRIELLFPVEAPEGRQQGAGRARRDVPGQRQGAGACRPTAATSAGGPAKGEEAYRAQLELYREAKRALDRQRAGTGVTLEPIRSPRR